MPHSTSHRLSFAALAAALLLAAPAVLRADDPAAASIAADPAIVSTDSMAIYGGAEVVGTRGLPIASVVSQLDVFDGVTIGVEATIEEVCKVKGCWMTLKTGVEGSLPVRVRFRDYGFFVPRNAAGHRAVLIGRVARVELSEELARHYAEDGGASPEEIAKIVGPQPGIEIVATSVAIDGPAKLDAPYGSEPEPDAAAAPTTRPTTRPSTRPAAK